MSVVRRVLVEQESVTVLVDTRVKIALKLIEEER